MKAKTDFYRVLSIHHDKKSFLNDIQFFWWKYRLIILQ